MEPLVLLAAVIIPAALVALAVLMKMAFVDIQDRVERLEKSCAAYRKAVDATLDRLTKYEEDWEARLAGTGNSVSPDAPAEPEAKE